MSEISRYHEKILYREKRLIYFLHVRSLKFMKFTTLVTCNSGEDNKNVSSTYLLSEIGL